MEITQHLANITEKTKTVPAEALLTKSCTKLTPPAKETIENLWATMTQLYGHKWISSYGAKPDPMGVWAASLKGISPEMIKSGLGKLISRNYEWPPSAPEFSNLCRPSLDDFDVPTLDESVELIDRFGRAPSARLDPFTYTMYMRMSNRMYDIRRMNERDHRNEMKRYYEATAKALVAGDEMLVQPEMIEAKPPEPKPILDCESKFEDLKRRLA